MRIAGGGRGQQGDRLGRRQPDQARGVAPAEFPAGFRGFVAIAGMDFRLTPGAAAVAVA